MGIFNSAIFNNQVFNTTGVIPVVVDTHDGASADEYKRYRKKLLAAAKAAEQHNESKYLRQALAVAEVLDEYGVSAPEVQKVANAVENNIDISINYELLSSELMKSIRYLEDMIDFRQRQIEEEDEEEYILMMML